jgi:Type II CAAX prenyl endopeptidase Rce1-like
VRAGLGYGAGAFGIVLLVLVVAAVIPATSGFLHDSRAQISGGRLLYELGVSIVLLTAIPEEFAFRGVLLGSALRLWGPWRASVITSALFGLWHIEPTLHTMRDNRAVAGAAASAPLMPVPRQPRNVRRPHRIRDTHPHEPPSGQPARPPGGIESLRVPRLDPVIRTDVDDHSGPIRHPGEQIRRVTPIPAGTIAPAQPERLRRDHADLRVEVQQHHVTRSSQDSYPT